MRMFQSHPDCEICRNPYATSDGKQHPWRRRADGKLFYYRTWQRVPSRIQLLSVDGDVAYVSAGWGSSPDWERADGPEMSIVEVLQSWRRLPKAPRQSPTYSRPASPSGR